MSKKAYFCPYRMRILILLLSLFSAFKLSATASKQPLLPIKMDTSVTTIEIMFAEAKGQPNPILHKFKVTKTRNKQVVAAILAFPIPFGMVGLHRIYLGTSPYVPVVYIATLGGLFGILPFIDFCVLLLDTDIDKYKSNQKVFMWLN